MKISLDSYAPASESIRGFQQGSSGEALVDPATAIVTALALGAAASVKEAASQATKDAYQALKSYISGRYESIRFSDIEKKPASLARRAVLQEELKETDIGGDQKAAELASALVQAVSRNDPEVANIVGVDLEDIEAANIRLKEIASSGTGVRMRRVGAANDLHIEKVRAGVQTKGRTRKN